MAYADGSATRVRGWLQVEYGSVVWECLPGTFVVRVPMHEGHCGDLQAVVQAVPA